MARAWLESCWDVAGHPECTGAGGDPARAGVTRAYTCRQLPIWEAQENVARDLYSRIVELDDATLRTVADVLELRGRHPQQVAIRDAYLSSLGSLEGKRVLDVGCGTGVVTRELARRVGPDGQVTGVDPSPV